VLASTNAGKLAEFRELLADTPIELAANLPADAAPAETGATFVENALIKARHAALVTGRPALADDSGLCVDGLGGAPGVVSARYAGPAATDADNVAQLLDALERFTGRARRATFHCVIVALASPDDPAPIIATGRWHGEIAEAPRGEFGFGYDPVFLDPGSARTAAELSPAVKNRISHRARACADLKRLLLE
jgi:XTP/dITP diphosphohydrolase